MANEKEMQVGKVVQIIGAVVDLIATTNPAGEAVTEASA